MQARPSKAASHLAGGRRRSGTAAPGPDIRPRLLSLGEIAGIPFVADAPAMQPVVDLIRRLGPSSLNVLVTGEPGSGRSLVARVLHALSLPERPRAHVVDAAELHEDRFARGLFGEGAGGPTGPCVDSVLEPGEAGVVILEELAAVGDELHARLLRLFERGEYEPIGGCDTRRTRARLIATAEAQGPWSGSAGRFQAAIVAGLKTVEIALPPLRARPADIAPLARRFLVAHAVAYGVPVPDLPPAALSALAAYGWPGNVRELGRAIECAVVTAGAGPLSADDLGLDARGRVASVDGLTLAEAEWMLVRCALVRFRGRLGPAARSLGISPQTLVRLRRRSAARPADALGQSDPFTRRVVHEPNAHAR
jgi:DNA-binding NtrC family response regulator